MADRTVVARLVLDIAGYTPAAMEASKSTTALAAAQKETAAAAAQAAAAQRDAAAVAKDAAAQASAAAKAVTVAERDAAAAAKEAAAAEAVAAKAGTDAEREEAAAVAATAAERAAAAKESVSAAEQQAEATARNAAAAKDAAAAAAGEAAAQRDVAAAAKEAAVSEAAAAKDAETAAAARTKAYDGAGKALTTMALGTEVAAGLMVKSAGDFQSSTEHLVTDAGETQANLGMVQAGILKTAAATGTGATQLVDAMYHIESAGFHGANGLTLLTTAAEGAKVGNADLDITAKTLTGTMNSYNMTGDQSVSMMNGLIATVGAGDMKLNDLASSLGNVTAIGASAKLSYAEVAGAVATMTSQNMTADRSTQDLAHTISSLQNPNNVQIAQMQQLGLDSNDVSMNLGKRGLTGTLEMLTTAVAEHTQNGAVFIDTLKQSQNAAADANTMLKQLPPSIQGVAKQLLDGTITAAQYNKEIGGLDASQQHLAKQYETLVKSSGSFNDLLKSGKPEAESFNAAMSKMLGGTTGLNTALMLTGGRMVTFKDNVATVQAAMDKGGTSVDNWDKIQGTFNQKIDVAKASIGALWIAIGTTLLPVVADVAKAVASVITPIAAWVNEHQTLTAVVLGSAAALAALVLVINLAMKGAELVKNAVGGVSAAVQFFTKNAEAAAAETEALAAAETAAAVKTEALGAAHAAAAAETEAASTSTAGWAGKLGGTVPVIGAVIGGTALLGQKLGALAGVGDHTAMSIDKLNTSMLGISTATPQAQQDTVHLGEGLAVMSQKLGGPVQGLKDYDASLAKLVSSGHAADAKAIIDQITAAADSHGKKLVNVTADFPAYQTALDAAANSAKAATTATDGSTQALDANAAAADAAGSSTAAATQAGKDQAAALYEAAGAARANADAQTAEADDVLGAAAAHTGAATAVTAHTAATKDATAAAKDATAAATKDATAAKDSTKAAVDQGNAVNDSAKADAAAATAAKAKAAADAAGGSSAKLNAKATKDAAAASRAAATEGNAYAKSASAQGTADTAAAKAADAHAKAVDASAKAAAASSKAAGDDAAAQAAAAEAAKEAAYEHDIGTEALKGWAAAAADTAHATDTLDSSVADEVTAMKDAKTKTNDLKDALDALNGVHIAAGKAALDVQNRIADLTKALHDNGSTMDITTQKGRDNMTQVYDLAAAINSHAQAVVDETGSIDAGNKAMDASRDEFDKVLTAAGLSKDKIKDFNDTLLETPKLVGVTIALNTDDANQKLKEFRNSAGQVLYMQLGVGTKAAFAHGGMVTGTGTDTSDNVPIMASPGEWVVPAPAARAFGYDNLARITSAAGGTIVKPQPIASVGGTTAQPSMNAAGAALHIENFHAGAASPQAVAAELGWLSRARGGSW